MPGNVFYVILAVYQAIRFALLIMGQFSRGQQRVEGTGNVGGGMGKGQGRRWEGE